MTFQTAKTIRSTINEINNGKYLLPAIQRELVWDAEQIEKLFDSLMRDYPIGSFLFWNVAKENVKEYQFYEFLRNYHEKKNRHSPKANVSGNEDITAILDGQQRLTALYIGLKGTYASKLPRKHHNNPYAFPEKKLYLNLLSEAYESDFKYAFKFLTNKDAQNIDENTFWFEVGKILDFEPENPTNTFNFLIENGLSNNKFAGECLFKLAKLIHDKGTINYYLEEGQELDKVLNIFIRVNSGGTQLSYSDLLLSIATAQWAEKDAREEITNFVDEINVVGDGFYFNKDLVLKTCLVLSDFSNIAFKVDNFNATNMRKIEQSWDKIKKAIQISVNLVHSFGYNYQTLSSNYAIIPIAYYVYSIENPENFVLSSKYKGDRKFIKNWLLRALLKKVFGGQPDSVLRPMREIIKDNEDNVFPLSKIIENTKGTNKSLLFNDDEIENLLFHKYGQNYTFSVLSLIYPQLDYRNKFHQDHIFPKKLFTHNRLLQNGIPQEKHEFYIDNFNCIGNLQLLEGMLNEEKSGKDFEQWVEAEYPDDVSKMGYMDTHLIPNISLEFSNFDVFIEKRNRAIAEKLKKLVDADV